MSSWFVDKLGPVPNAVTGKGSLSTPPARVEDRAPTQAAQRAAAPQAKAAPAAKAAPEPEKKKKKGWF